MGRTREAAALTTTLELFETGVEMMRQNLRRRHPQATEAELDEKLGDWLRHRPGAESGDCPGRLRQIPDLGE